jgi:hypothetical protein
MLTAERLRELLHYDPETGLLTWRVSRGSSRAGDVAEGLDGRGYRRVRVDRSLYYAHRIAWLWMTGEWPADHIDHINGIPGDDRWANLRLATNAQNTANGGRRVTNKSGFKGVWWHKPTSKWRAAIMASGRSKHLGLFDCPAAAHAAYAEAAKKYFGKFARVT